MQRSRRALLQRRALEDTIGGASRNRLYTVSVSAVVVLWGLTFLLNTWNGNGDGQRGQSIIYILLLQFEQALINIECCNYYSNCIDAVMKF